MCQYGHSVVREIFRQEKSENLSSFVVFLPMLEDDNQRTAMAQSQSLTDERVLQAWDPAAEMGALLTATLGMTETAWDVYLVYPPGVTWDQDAPPEPTYWMHQLSEQYGVGDAPMLDPEKLRDEVKRQLQIFE